MKFITDLDGNLVNLHHVRRIYQQSIHVFCEFENGDRIHIREGVDYQDRQEMFDHIKDQIKDDIIFSYQEECDETKKNKELLRKFEEYEKNEADQKCDRNIQGEREKNRKDFDTALRNNSKLYTMFKYTYENKKES
jgi:hypothetical protein